MRLAPRERWGWREYRILLIIPVGVFCLIMALVS
jgi:hypothetical protein